MPDNPSVTPVPFASVILAAGASKRMGLGRSKLLLPWASTSILGHLLNVWRELGAAQIAVVYAAGDAALQVEFERLALPEETRIPNSKPEDGMFSSIRAAAQWQGWAPHVRCWAAVLGDQPHLSIGTLRELLRFSAAHPERVCQPSHAGKRRHPVLLPERAFRSLALSDGPTLKHVLEGLPEGVALCPVDDPGLDLDLDTPSDYQEAVKLFMRV
jgi:molybdenum cofactor cytidylyltransferase